MIDDDSRESLLNAMELQLEASKKRTVLGWFLKHALPASAITSGVAIVVIAYNSMSIRPRDVYRQVQYLTAKMDAIELKIEELRQPVNPVDVMREVRILQRRLEVLQESLEARNDTDD